MGNSRTRFVWFDNQGIVRRMIVPTTKVIESLERLRLTKDTRGAAVASVVPKLTLPVYRRLCQETPTLLVGATTKTPLRFHYDRRALGADRVCVAVGAYTLYKKNLIIIDFGTAITFNIVKRNGDFLGGPILPGAEMLLSCLAEKTARLPRVGFLASNKVICRTTKPAIQTGVFNLLRSGLNDIIKRICIETGESYFVVATGGLAQRFGCHLRSIKVVDEDLGSKGLREIFYLNKEVR
ncbi:MAG: type III pantothenate kinase [candidate division WOR-3 bacterium]